MTARAVYEQSCNAAFDRYKANLDVMADTDARKRFLDDLQKAGDKYALNAAEQRRVVTIRARDLDAALAAMHADADAEAAARRRDLIDSELSAVAVRKLRHTAGAR